MMNTLAIVNNEGFNAGDPAQRYREFVRQHPELNEFHIATELDKIELESTIHFLHLKGRAEGKIIHPIPVDFPDFRPDDLVLTCLDNHYTSLQSKYRVEIVREGSSCRLFRILEAH